MSDTVYAITNMGNKGGGEVNKVISKKEHLLDSDCPDCLVEYVSFIANINSNEAGCLYGMDSMRRQLHIKMAEYYGAVDCE